MAATRDVQPLDRRDADALTRCMTVQDDVGAARGAPGLYLVTSDSGREYLVDLHERVCSCPDSRYRQSECVHQRRVRLATGRRVIPAWVDASRVDSQLGAHVARRPVWEGDQ